MSVAFVFPGQGAQEVGMGRSMFEAFAATRAVFDTVDESLGDSPSLSSLVFGGPVETLTLTANTQPAILAASLGCLAALRVRCPTLAPSLVAGHSLGEYSALVAAGALDLATAARLLRLRGRAMQDAVPPGVGAMSAVVMLDDALVVKLCATVEAELPGRVVSTANFNAPGQVVIAGHADAVARVGVLAAEHRGRAMPLNVSAPFHCALMKPAAQALAEGLGAVQFGPLGVPLVANVDAAIHCDAGDCRALLVAQADGAVRWADSVRAMLAAGVTTFVEIGPGRVLAGLIKRVQKGATVLSVSDPESLEAAAAALETAGYCDVSS